MSSLRLPKKVSKAGIRTSLNSPLRKSKVSNVKNKIFLNQEIPNPDEKWTDTLFPPTEKSLLSLDEIGQTIDPKESKKSINPAEIEWKRASDIFPEPYLFEKDISVNDVNQGKIGNCYFMSTIAAMCEFPGLITKIFLTKEYNPNGYYKLKLFIDGQYQIVYVDDYFPCIKGTNVLYFAKPNSFELWVLLLEKAWAKINGGYSNIVSGWPCEVFRTFTGFACEYLHHHEEHPDRLWGVIRAVDKSKGLICTSTREDKEMENFGLIPNHTYTLIDTEEIEDDKKRLIRLCKLRNPWGDAGWKGDWSKDSELWTEFTKSQVDETNFNLNEGEFFISVEDLCKYFLRSDLCQIVYNGITKTFDFPQNELNFPQVFNFYVPIEGTVSIAVIEKCWRFNRELRGISHPTSLIIGEYDPEKKTIKHCFCDFESYTDCEKTRFLNPGYYIVWAYKGLAESEKPFPESMIVRFISDCQISIKQVGPDRNFQIIQQIIYQGVKHRKRKMIKDDEIYYEVNNQFNRSGISYRLVINPLKTAYQKWEVDSSDLRGISLLPPYSNQEKFTFNIGPNNFGIILGIRKQDYGKFSFNLKCDAEQYECREGEDPFEIERPDFDTFCLSDIDRIEFTEGDRTGTLEELSKREEYPIIDHSKVYAKKLYEKYPLIMDSLISMEPQPGKKKLGWIQLQKDNGIYIGEADYNTPEGRGMFYFPKEELTYIGYFDNGNKCGFGKLYDKNNTLVYEGEYKDGQRNGKGTYHYPGGERYEGDFVDGYRQGNGKFYWNDGSSWQGTFVDNEMDGKGIYSDGTDSWPVNYKKGELVD